MKNIRIISASAGSGKTTRLASELESAVVGGKVAPDAILATTFTRKAAAELLERGRRVLLSAERVEEAERFGAARIGTVNSVCGRLVEDFAFELGLSPSLQVLDEKRAREAFKRCLAEVVTEEEQARLSDIEKRFYEFEWQPSVQKVVDLSRANGLGPDNLENCKAASVESFKSLLGPKFDNTANLDQRLVDALERFIAGAESRLEDGVDTTKKTQAALAEAQRSLHDMKGLGFQQWRRWLKLSKLAVGKKSEEQGGGSLIPDGPSKPGVLYTVAKGPTGMLGLYRLELQVTPAQGSSAFQASGRTQRRKSPSRLGLISSKRTRHV